MTEAAENIPDIIIQKTGAEQWARIELLIDGKVAVSEKYVFDNNGIVHMRDIGSIVSAYFMAVSTVHPTHLTTTGLLLDVQVRIATGDFTTYQLKVDSTTYYSTLRIDIQDPVLNLDIRGLSDICTVGDVLTHINGIETTHNVLFSIHDQAEELVFTDLFNGDIEDSYITMRTPLTSNFEFEVLRCEIDMPASVMPNVFVPNNFLTRLPREKRTGTNENEYLSFLHQPIDGAVNVRYKMYYLDGVVVHEETGVLLNIAATTAKEIVTFNASVAMVRALSAHPTAYIYSYDLWVEKIELDTTTNVFTMLMADIGHRNKVRFVFENSFGVLETFTATGSSSTKKTVDFGFGNIQNKYKKIAQYYITETSQNSGFLTPEEMDWIDDLLLSYNVAIYMPGVSGAQEEIVIIAVDKVDDNSNTMNAFNFTYRPAKNNMLQFTAAAKGIFDDTFNDSFN